MKTDLKKGDIVENYGFESMSWYETITCYPKWWYQDFSYWFKKQYQRIKFGFPLEESWGFNSACARWSLPRLKKLRQEMNSCPSSFARDESINGEIKWKETLDKIIWSFEHFEDIINPIYPENFDRRQIVIDNSEDCVTFKPVDERKPDWTPVEEHERKLQEGFDLFGKHFRELWD